LTFVVPNSKVAFCNPNRRGSIHITPTPHFISHTEKLYYVLQLAL